MSDLETCIRSGYPLLIEGVEEWIDPLLDPILQRDIYKRGLNYLIKLGNEELSYNNDFKLFMTSKIANPHFVPELSIKVPSIN